MSPALNRVVIHTMVDDPRTMGDIVAEALSFKQTPYGARPALCRLLLADAKLNSEVAHDKYQANFAPGRPTPTPLAWADADAQLEEWVTFLERIGSVHEECAALVATYKSAERPRGAREEWARLDKELVAGLQRCATDLEKLAESHSRSRGTGRVPR